MILTYLVDSSKDFNKRLYAAATTTTAGIDNDDECFC